MSLKFGIYLVEQRIISPEQFCGLVKIQQEATMSLATIAIRKNFLTIKQVARVLDLVELNPERSFIQAAIAEDLIDANDADRMLHEQQYSCPAIQKLVVECGLLTARQSEVLEAHFEKQLANGIKPVAAPAPIAEPADPAPRFEPRQPKFQQRPAATQTYSAQTH
jgi:hypothetical protein